MEFPPGGRQHGSHRVPFWTWPATERTGKRHRQCSAKALGAFLFTCYDMGTLDEVLTDCGFEASTENRYSATSATNRLVPFQTRQQVVQAATAH